MKSITLEIVLNLQDENLTITEEMKKSLSTSLRDCAINSIRDGEVVGWEHLDVDTEYGSIKVYKPE